MDRHIPDLDGFESRKTFSRINDVLIPPLVTALVVIILGLIGLALV